jgi:hypothetical protein
MTIQIDNIIDFRGATHGHFLEYVINSWIFGGPRVTQVFTELGTSHRPGQDNRYLHSRLIKCGHFTESSIDRSCPKKIIQINVKTPVGRWIHMINVMYRAGDIALPNSYKCIPEDIVSSPAKLRMNWFSKFRDEENSYPLDHVWNWPEVNGFDFPMENLYDLSAFYKTLHECAAYLEQKFTPDHELYTIWKKFMQLNQGIQIYNKSKQIAELALGQENYKFSSVEPEQALTNVLLSETVGIHDGPMFTNDVYPTNTIEIWKSVKDHLDNFDNRF